MKIYISGKIAGLVREDAIQNFKKIQILLEKLGYETVNPFEIQPYHPDKTWEEYMVNDIRELFKCNAICLLPNWTESKGAKVEKAISETLGYAVLFAEDFFKQKELAI